MPPRTIRTLAEFELPDSWRDPLGHSRFNDVLLVDDHPGHHDTLIMIANDHDRRHTVRGALPMAHLWVYDEFARSFRRPAALIGETPVTVATTVAAEFTGAPPNHDADPDEIGQAAAAMLARLVPMNGHVMQRARLHPTTPAGTGWDTHIELVDTNPLEIYTVHTTDYGPNEPKILTARLFQD